ncbi:hypothetical protein LCGC14_2346940 [marine sediment metagenome]|uniref:Uncharacterized protein n=1 Tax=marine sediment metagenome TaxID=412755 RepID=A0A0F9F5I1_9ZZZZ
MAMCPFNSRQCPESSVGSIGCYFWGTGCPVRAGGDTYSKTMTMSDDNATRFETAEKSLRDVIILVETNPMLLGSTGVEIFPVATNGSIGWSKVDISTLFFKNAGAGNNGKITILAVEDPGARV